MNSVTLNTTRPVDSQVKNIVLWLRDDPTAVYQESVYVIGHYVLYYISANACIGAIVADGTRWINSPDAIRRVNDGRVESKPIDNTDYDWQLSIQCFNCNTLYYGTECCCK